MDDTLDPDPDAEDAFDNLLQEAENEENHTARDLAKILIRGCGFRYEKFPNRLRMDIIFAEAIKMQLAETSSKSREFKARCIGMLSGQVIRAARVQRMLSEALSINPRRIR